MHGSRYSDVRAYGQGETGPLIDIGSLSRYDDGLLRHGSDRFTKPNRLIKQPLIGMIRLGQRSICAFRLAAMPRIGFVPFD